MLAKRLRLLLFTPDQATRRQTMWGLIISVAIATLYGYLAMRKGFAADYVIQDDARHYLFWMARFRDTNAFPNDLIANYLQSIAPLGYVSLYRVADWLNMHPDWFAKVLPMLLGMIVAGYYYGLTLAIFPLPFAGIMSSVLLSQHLWCTDDLATASPRSFIYPGLIALLFYFVRRQWWQSLLCLAVLALFYAPTAMVALTLFWLYGVNWDNVLNQGCQVWRNVLTNPHRISQYVHPFHLKLAIGATVITALCVLPTYLSSQEFGPTVTMAQALTMPEFQAQGRQPFFADTVPMMLLSWLGGHAGVFKRTMFTPVTLLIILGLPFMARPMLASKFPLLHTINRHHSQILLKLSLASLPWFVAAYVIAFKLYMPNRYTSHCIMVAVPLLAAITWCALLERACRTTPRLAPMILALVLMPVFFYYPLFLKNFPKTLYITGHAAPIYEYLQAQPQGTLVASLDMEANNIPSFAKQSTLIAREYGTPYQMGYYRQMRQRATDAITAHYTDQPAVLSEFVAKYGINLWLINKGAFTPEYLENHRYWRNNYQKLHNKIVDGLRQGKSSVLETKVAACLVSETATLWLVDADCTTSSLGETTSSKRP